MSPSIDRNEYLARSELEALANLIERPPLDDVLLERAVALRAANAIRTILANLETRAAPNEVGPDLAAIGPRPVGKVLGWIQPRPCFYKNTDLNPCGYCHGCRERIARESFATDTTPSRDREGSVDRDMLSEIAASAIVMDVAELPDRTSPDDWPDAMLVTAEELREIVLRNIASLAALKTSTPETQTVEGGGDHFADAGKPIRAMVLEEAAQVAEKHAAPDGVPRIDYDDACRDIAAAIRALLSSPIEVLGSPECPHSPTGRHQVDTSMESGPNNCFHCEAPMRK